MPYDGPISRLLNRRFSRPLARVAARRGMTPNQATLVSTAVAASVPLLFSANAPRLAGLMTQAASIVDGKPPKTMLVVSVYWAFIHCGKALNRSRVWTPDYFVDANKWKLARGTLENSYESAVKLR